MKGLAAHSCNGFRMSVRVFLETLHGTRRGVELHQRGSWPKTILIITKYLTLERQRGGGSNRPPIGFSDLKFEPFKQSK